MKNTNVTWQQSKVTPEQRTAILKHRGGVLWLTGPSGAGKTTLAQNLEVKLIEAGKLCTHLDGDNIRHGLCSDLGFSLDDRTENIRRIAEVSKLFSQSGQIVLTTFISPTESIRELAKNIIGESSFHEIFVNCPIETCEERDPKGLYKKARKGEIKEFTGITSPYEKPEKPKLIINTNELNIDEATNLLFEYIHKNF